MNLDFIKNKIDTVPDFPKPGIPFKDITPLLKDPSAFDKCIDVMASLIKAKGLNPTIIAGIESRGFFFGVALAQKLGLGFVPIRKPGKLPKEVYSVSYDLEYGSDTIEVHKEAFTKDDRVLIIDDVLATGGTARAAADLVNLSGAKIEVLLFLMELPYLNGRKLFDKENIEALIEF